MNLVIDIGNTLVKCAIYKNDDIIEIFQAPSLTKSTLSPIFLKFPAINSTIISDVRNLDVKSIIKGTIKKSVILFDHTTSVPITNRYETPETLGKDRLAAAVGAFAMFSNQNTLVIDAGTSITYDIVTAKGEYLGGSISPGIGIRYKALNTFTGKLPLVEADWNKEPELVGNTTVSSIKSCVQTAILQEVDGMINQYKRQFFNLKIVVTGGDYKLCMKITLLQSA